jgi:N-acetylglucosamine-6-phosphate deacetylase
MTNRSNVLALRNGRVLRDEGFVEGLAVLVDGTRIVEVLPQADPRVSAATQRDLGGQLLMPGFIDTQVNGGGGVLFNDAPTVDSIRAIGAAHRRFGTTGFLPTLISDDLHVIEAALGAVREAMSPASGDASVPGVLGIHIEGPFLNPERKGVHDPAKLRALDADAIKLLTTPTGGRTMVTLAPEMTTPTHIRALAEAGVIVSAGHSNATYAQTRAALDAGMRGFTHLFNAMSQLGNREPGMVGAALDDESSWCGLIVDGVHVSPVTMRIAMRAARTGRFMLVTDAMPNTGSDIASFALAGKRVTVRDGSLYDENGTLAGASLTMASAVANAVRLLGVEMHDAARMASAQPAAFLRLDRVLGRIERGMLANLVLVNDQLEVLDTWIDGQPMA